jgi:putative membrane protein
MLWILVLFLLILFVTAVISFFKKEKGAELYNTRKSTLEIIRQRYAKGEITKQEFEEKKRVLGF